MENLLQLIFEVRREIADMSHRVELLDRRISTLVAIQATSHPQHSESEMMAQNAVILQQSILLLSGNMGNDVMDSQVPPLV